MSDNWIIFVPKDPDWIPAGESEVKGAIGILEEALPGSHGIETETRSYYGIVHAGSNWEGVFCPFCGAAADDWWSDSFPSFDERTSFQDLSITTECCSRQTKLNELHFPWHFAFSRFELSIMNPSDPANSPGTRGVGALPAGLLEHLQRQLGTELAVVWRHL